MIDLTGQRFGRLTVLGEAERSPSGYRRYRCRCDCGGETATAIANLRNGHTQSCGCLQKERMRDVKPAGSDGRSKTVLFGRWQMMIQRCHNPKRPDFPNYGGRGIRVCERWRASFHHFSEDVGQPPTLAHKLERKDNNKGYEPGNVVWATNREQSRNRRTNTVLEINGVRRTLVEWAESAGIPYGTFMARLRMGWAPERAIAESVKPSRLVMTFEGRTQALHQWTKEFGLNYGIAQARLKRGFLPGLVFCREYWKMVGKPC